ncbi:L,D-transpeptidase family protein [Oceanospirillum maris]|uniref:L,D-transpeptidase family protein n=1 Tax=Oceanospirillum maris TaxID=64977 RepID=UPI00048673B6|nr:L,D-transpeptidase family protein [Oceanospirillum maris]
MFSLFLVKRPNRQCQGDIQWLLRTVILCLFITTPAMAALTATEPASKSVFPHQPSPASTATIETAWVDVTLRSRFSDAKTRFAAQIAPVYLDNDFKHIWLDASGNVNDAAKSLVRLVEVLAALSSTGKNGSAAPQDWLRPYQQFLQWQKKPMTLALPRYLLATDLLYSEMYARLRHDIATERFIEWDMDNDHEEYLYGGNALNDFKSTQSPWAQDITLELKTASVLPSDERAVFLARQVNALYPASSQKEPLLDALRYWQQQTDDVWPELSKTEPLLSPGMIRENWMPVLVEQLQRLKVLGDGYQADIPGRYDSQLVAAVKRVQAMHGQIVDGMIGIQTRRVLNMSPAQRVRQLAHNFRRLYHLPEKLGDRYLMINMADYNLELVEKNKPTLQMRVIIGSRDSRTPIMKQSLTSVILSPRWNIPKSIGAKSIFPKAKNNPNYLKSREIQVVNGWSSPAEEVSADQINFADFDDPSQFPYRFVQLPGDHNQLGYVKFRLSNNKAIYMHDTPAKSLFNRRERAMSNGCVRLENALLLVDRLLGSEPWGWTNKRVQDVLRSKEERYLKMEPHLPVYLMYWTVWQDDNGDLQWRDDIYDKDHLPEPERTTKLLVASKKESH